MFGRNRRNRVEETLAEGEADTGKSFEQAAVRLPMVTINISLIATVPVVLFHFPCTVHSSILSTEAEDTSAMSVPIYESVWSSIPKEQFMSALSASTVEILLASSVLNFLGSSAITLIADDTISFRS